MSRRTAGGLTVRGAIGLLACGALLAGGCRSEVARSEVARSEVARSAVTPGPSSTGRVAPAPALPTVSTGASPSASPATSIPAILDLDRPPATSQAGPGAPAAPTVELQHDAALASLLLTLARNLESGDEKAFLAPFAVPLRGRVGHWFGNTRALGVARALIARSDDYSSAAVDSPSSFTRTVVVGVRTPYDDGASMPGIAYGITVSTAAKVGRHILTITSWQPRYLGDPMNCDCTLTVVHTATTAVVSDAADADLAFWSTAALRAASDGIAWSYRRLQGSGLVAPKGQVIFLADKPFHWFLGGSGPAQSTNLTAALVDAAGSHPGTRYSNQSRIVLMLQSADGSVVPNNAQGREYVTDVITHESTHQLMNRNSTLRLRTADSPPTWVVEGIAVAVETLHRDSLGDFGDVGYPEPNDPKNVQGAWFAAHLKNQMPTRSQLYSTSDGAGYYAISGSVFRYIDREYGYLTMLKVAKAMYAKANQNPFDYFPDPARSGALLPAAAAKSRWKAWFIAHYE